MMLKSKHKRSAIIQAMLRKRKEQKPTLLIPMPRYDDLYSRSIKALDDEENWTVPYTTSVYSGDDLSIVLVCTGTVTIIRDFWTEFERQ